MIVVKQLITHTFQPKLFDKAATVGKSEQDMLVPRAQAVACMAGERDLQVFSWCF